MTMEAKKACILGLITIFLIFGSPAMGTGDEYESSIASLVREVLERNPALSGARGRKQAAEHLILPSGTLPDPQIGFSMSNFPVDNFSRSREPMTSIDVFLTQKIPFPGKLSMKEEIAGIRSKQAEESVAEIENMLIFRTKKAYYKLFEVSQAIDITMKTKAVLKEFLEVARQRYAVGRALQQDVLRAQTGVSNIERRLFELGKMKIETVARINTLRAREVDAHVSPPTALSLEEVVFSDEELVESAERFNPTLVRMGLKIEEGKTGVALAQRERYPDFALSTRYRVREDRTDFFTGAVTLSVPLFASRKQNEIIASNTYALKSSESAYEAYLDRITFNIRDIRSDLHSLRNRISLLDSAIIPAGKHTVESALAAYRVGNLEFNSLVAAELDLFKYELELAALTSKHNVRVAELWMIVGKSLIPNEVSDE